MNACYLLPCSLFAVGWDISHTMYTCACYPHGHMQNWGLHVTHLFNLFHTCVYINEQYLCVCCLYIKKISALGLINDKINGLPDP